MKKKILIIILVILVLVTSFIVIYLNKNDSSSEEKISYQNQTIYINMNPLLKIEYEESFKLCEDASNSKICSEITTKITNVEYLNSDAKRIYNNINLMNKDIYEGIKKVIKEANDSNINTSIIDITSTSGNFLVEKIGLDDDIEINYVFNPDVRDEDIINESLYRFTIIFDTDGGSTILSQIVNINEKVLVPEIPTKEGYLFVEWELDGKPYDFETPVTSDLTLKANWETIVYPVYDE